MTNYIAKSAALKIRSKLNFKEPKTMIVDFIKNLVKSVDFQNPEVSNKIYPLIAYSLGILQHPMFDEISQDSIFLVFVCQ